MDQPEHSPAITELCSIDLGDNGGPHHFHTKEEMLQWLSQEIEAWNWLDSRENRELNPRNPREALKEILNLLRDQPDEQFAAQFSRDVRKIFGGTEPHVCSRCKFAATVIIPNKEQPDRAAWALAARAGVFNSSFQNALSFTKSYPRHVSMIQGLADTISFEGGVLPVAISEAAKQGVEVERAAVRQQQKELNVALEKARRLSERFDALIARHEEQRLEDQRKWDGLANEHVQRMKAIENKYADDIKVRAAVNYWNQRKASQQESCSNWQMCSAGGLVIGLVILFLAVWLIPPVNSEVVQLIRESQLKDGAAVTALLQSTFSSVARFAVFATLVIWPLRIVVRNYVSASHLATDAAEREILVQTYLALVNDPDIADKPNIRDQALPQMLQSIFRHASDGLVRDDGLPIQSVFDAIKGVKG